MPEEGPGTKTKKKTRAGRSEAGERKRAKQKEKFVSLAWDNINAANVLIARQLKRAVEMEEEIDALIAFFTSLGSGEITEKQRLALIDKVEKLKMEDMKKLVSTLGTLCDKQAQAQADGSGEGAAVQAVIDPSLEEYAE
ncbi:MAG: hypothetical protein IJU52_08325 [Clostridia bacterium]|nr:hypothetical protein [Clostridia bacterium]